MSGLLLYSMTLSQVTHSDFLFINSSYTIFSRDILSIEYFTWVWNSNTYINMKFTFLGKSNLFRLAKEFERNFLSITHKVTYRVCDLNSWFQPHSKSWVHNYGKYVNCLGLWYMELKNSVYCKAILLKSDAFWIKIDVPLLIKDND